MSTKERAGRRGSAAGIVIALLCLAGLACLGVYIYRQQLPPPRRKRRWATRRPRRRPSLYMTGRGRCWVP